MNQEIPMEEELSSEGQKIEAIISEAEGFVLEGEKQLEALPEDQQKALEIIKDKKFEPLSSQIIEKLGGMLEMAMPER